jgi:replicative superfamily II helicase
MLTHAIPIESQFKALLPDNLNAEIVLGSVSNVKEAVAWLTYTYMAVRMRQNPLVYGITFEQLAVSYVGVRGEGEEGGEHTEPRGSETCTIGVSLRLNV